jgi:signal transduction histidine kinase
MATAGLDAGGTILAANERFRRLAGVDPSIHPILRLADVVADVHRPEVQQALDELDACHPDAPARTSLNVRRRKDPCLWLAIEMSRPGPTSIFPYLVCAQPILRRRRRDVAGPALSAVASETTREPRTSAAASMADTVGLAETWPPMLTLLSHELRGSLHAIRGWASMAQTGALPADRMPQALEIISRNAESLSRLVESVFDLSRSAASSLTLQLERVDLNTITRFVAESTYPAARRHDVTLNIGCARAAVLVSADRVRMEQVIRNLLDNAVKFTPPGGKVSVRTSCRRGYGELVVADTGAGIPANLLPAIFDPFRQGMEEMARQSVGVGLGLALVRELVQLHRGEVLARSLGAGHGSTFVVRLPLAETGREPYRAA